MPQLKSLKKITPILLLVVALFLPSVRSDASTVPTFHKNYGQPTTSSNSGYLEIYWGTKNGSQEGVDVYYWSILPYKGSDTSNLSNSTMGLVIGNSAGNYYLKFNAGVGNSQLGYFSLIGLYSYSQVLENTPFTSTHSYEVDYSDNYTIYGYHVYGNFSHVNERVADYAFNVSYGTDNEYLTLIDVITTLNEMNDELGGKLDDVISVLGTLSTSVQNSASSLNAIYSYLYSQLPNIASLVGTTNTKLDTLISKLDTTNGKLGDIYDVLEQFWYDMTLNNPSDTHKGEQFEENSNAQADQLAQNNNIVDSVEKPNPSQLGSQTIGKLDFDSVGVFGATLAPFMSNSFILKMLVTSVILCIIGYIFFGKKG